VFETSSKTGDGFEDWLAYLEEQLQERR